MEFIKPSKTGFTIYSKSGCPDCKRAKELLSNENNIENINCDEYLLEDKEEFLKFIREETKGIEHRTFPMIFHDSKFIGGYKQLKEYYDNYTKNNVFESLESTDF